MALTLTAKTFEATIDFLIFLFIYSDDFHYQFFMEFQNFLTIHQKAIDVARSAGHQQIVDLLSHSNQN